MGSTLPSAFCSSVTPHRKSTSPQVTPRSSHSLRSWGKVRLINSSRSACMSRKVEDTKTRTTRCCCCDTLGRGSIIQLPRSVCRGARLRFLLPCLRCRVADRIKAGQLDRKFPFEFDLTEHRLQRRFLGRRVILISQYVSRKLGHERKQIRTAVKHKCEWPFDGGQMLEQVDFTVTHFDGSLERRDANKSVDDYRV